MADPTRADAWELLCEWTESDSLRKHALAVEASMRAYARIWGEDEQRFAITGLVHDLDYERHPDLETGHPRIALAELEKLGYPEDVIDAVAGHAEFLEVPRETRMAKTLFAVDELSGFVMACALVRPTGIEGMKVKSVRKKLKQPSFAAKVDRGQIERAIAELEVDESEHIARIIDALSADAEALGVSAEQVGSGLRPLIAVARAGRIVLLLLVVLGALLAVNTVVLNDQTQPAEQTKPNGEVFELEDGVGLQYVDEPATGGGSEGQPIVLLHCYACSGQWWEPIVPLLNVEHRVITIDLIGHGGSEKPSSGYEISAQSAAVAALLNELGVSGATVVGHSMGGLVATSLAEQSSELVDRLVLIGTPSEADQVELPLLARLGTTPVIGQAIWRLRLDSMVQSAYGSSFAPGFDVERAFADPDRVVNDLDDMTYTSYDQSREAGDDFLSEQSVASRLAAKGIPVLAIDGAEDQVLDVDAVLDGFKAVPGARIERMEGVGHSPNVEEVEPTADLILGFAAEGEVFVPPSPTEPRPNLEAKEEEKKRKQGKRGQQDENENDEDGGAGSGGSSN